VVLATPARPSGFLCITPLQSCCPNDMNNIEYSTKKEKVKDWITSMLFVFEWEEIVGLNPRVKVDVQHDIRVYGVECGNRLCFDYLCPKRNGTALELLGL